MRRICTHVTHVGAGGVCGAAAVIVLVLGCQATPVVEPVNKADKTPNEAPAGAVGEPASRPATVEKIDVGPVNEKPDVRKPKDSIETTRQPLGGFNAETVVARGNFPLVYWPEAAGTVRIVNAKGEVVAEAYVAKRQIVRVDAKGVFAGPAQLSRGRLPEGEYQIILVAEGTGEVRQERRNMPPPPGAAP